MAELTLRPMTEAEFADFRRESIEGYAAAHVEAGNWEAGDAVERAEKQTDELLPRGTATPGMLLLTGEDAAGNPVGMVWAVIAHGELGTAWIYQIVVTPDRRGQGYGRALLEAAEDEVRRHGATEIGLNVFGGNHVARGLYETAGYDIASLHMRKRLSP